MPHTTDIEHSFIHSWRDVFLASWRKYPSPRRPDILSVDVINKEFDKNTGLLKTTRLIVAEGLGPLWLRPVRMRCYVICDCVGNSSVKLGLLPLFSWRTELIFGSSNVLFIEDTIVDPKNKIMKLYSRNITFDHILKMEELCTYSADKTAPDRTKFTQTAKITSFASSVAGPVEEFIVKKFKQNAQKGRDIMEAAIDLVQKEALSFDFV